MSEMIERVAVALAKTNGGDFYDPNFYTEEQRNVWRIKAKDAIEAMREPTRDMAYAGIICGGDAYPNEVWAEMINAALK